MKSIKAFSSLLGFILILQIHAEQDFRNALKLQTPTLGNPYVGCPPIDDPSHPIFLPFQGDCSKYISCSRGRAYAQICPLGLYWSSSTYRCDILENSDCPAEWIPTSPPIIGPTYPTNYINFPYSGDCNKYYQCQVAQCSPGSHWNSFLQQCDRMPQPGCNIGGPIIPPTLPQVPQIPSIAPTAPIPPPLIDALVPTAATPPTIPRYPIINPQPSSPNLPLYPIPAFPEDSVNLNQLCSQSGTTYVHYPGDCSRYIQCNGVAYVRKCPANLLWNAKLLTCDRFCV